MIDLNRSLRIIGLPQIVGIEGKEEGEEKEEEEILIFGNFLFFYYLNS